MREAVLPPEFPALVEAHRHISSFEFTRNFRFEIATHRDRISQALRQGRIADGLDCTFDDYRKAIACADACRATFAAWMRDYDVLLTASASGEAPTGQGTGDYRFCAMWTLLHVPCQSVPAGVGPAGLPVGAQLVGSFRSDDFLLAIGRWVSKALRS